MLGAFRPVGFASRVTGGAVHRALHRAFHGALRSSCALHRPLHHRCLRPPHKLFGEEIIALDIIVRGEELPLRYTGMLVQKETFTLEIPGNDSLVCLRDDR